jgi:hypothetical protein
VGPNPRAGGGVQFTRADDTKPRLPQLYTIDDGELVRRISDAAARPADFVPARVCRFNNISFFRWFSHQCGICVTPARICDRATTLGTPLASLRMQSRTIAHSPRFTRRDD